VEIVENADASAKRLSYEVAALFLVYHGFNFHYFSMMKSQVYAFFTIYILSHFL